MTDRGHGQERNCYLYKVGYYQWPILTNDDIGSRIQETSEPIIENGAVLEENPDLIMAFDYDDYQGDMFAGSDDDYDSNFTLSQNYQGTTS